MSGEKLSSHKVVLLGDSGVGKTSLIHRYIKGEFTEYSEPTVGALCSSKVVRVGDRDVELEIWDTAGQEKYRSLVPMYYRDAECAIVVYDIRNPESYDLALEYIDQIQQARSEKEFIVIVGNKVDLEPQRKVYVETVKQFAEEKGFLFSEVSAKSGQGIKEMFEEIAKRLPDTTDKEEKEDFKYVAVDKKQCCK